MVAKVFHETGAGDYQPQSADARPGMADLFPPAPKPRTGLDVYRLLSPTAGVRVSPLCLGAMSLGDQWTGFMGKAFGPEGSEGLLDAFYEAGGNFIDTSNNYQDGQSEHIIGEWMEKRGNRNDIVLATKFTTFYNSRAAGPYPGISVNYCGNHSKSLKVSVEDSLRKLRTDYIDLLYIHWWDHSTSIPELMQSLNDLVRRGKVLYLGVSDTPAWVVSQANEYARQRGLAQFVVYQGAWNLGVRDMERDIIPMCRNNGMAIAPYSVMGSGKFKTAKEIESAAALRGGTKPTEAELKVGKALEEVAKELGPDVHLAHVGMAWCRQMFTDCWPILGGTSIAHLKSNIDALDVVLTPEQMKKLDEASPFQHGFPTGRFGLDPRALPDHKPSGLLLTASGHIRFSGYPQA